MILDFTELSMCRSDKMRCRWVLFCWLLFTSTTAWDLYAEETQDLHSDLNDPVFQVFGKQKKDMQHEILSLLGLQHRPRPRAQATHNSAPKFMIDLYRTISTENNETLEDIPSHALLHDLTHNYTLQEVNAINNADVVMSFPLHQKKHHKSPRVNVQRYEFDVSDVSLEDTVTSAELRMYKTSLDPESSYKIHVYQVLTGKAKETVLLDQRTIFGYEQGWLVFDVTHAVDVWDLLEKDKLKIHVEIETSEGEAVDIKDVGILGEDEADEKQPFVVAFFKTSEEAHSRRRRGAGSKKRNRNRDRNKKPDNYDDDEDNKSRRDRSCKKRSLVVSFRELGWQDWIIAPDGYSAFYCNGECSFPLNAHMNATNHAIVQTLVHLMDPEAVPKPCCAPTKLNAISVLYFDDSSNVILKKYRNMIVKSCGCH